MSIQVAPGAWGQVFAVPADVVDQHIRLASGQQLKVLLYVLRHNGEGLEVRNIADGLGMPADDVADAMQYWLTTGFLERSGNGAGSVGQKTTAGAQAAGATTDTASGAPVPFRRKAEGVAESADEQPGKSPQKAKTHLETPDIVPTYETVTARLVEDSNIKDLFNEAQNIMGKTIGYDTQAKLLMMYDTYGLPTEVVLTIVEYSSRHKKGIAYMCKMAKNWADEGIVTFDDAMEKIQQLESVEQTWQEFTRMFTADPPRRTEERAAYLRKWRNTMGISLELIFYAYEYTIEHIEKINFKYMDKTLTGWLEDGLRTPQDVLQARTGEGTGTSGNGSAAGTGAGTRPASTRNTNRKLAGNNHAPSYNSDQYREKAQQDIVYPGKKDT